MSYKNNQLEESKRWSYVTEEELNEIYEFQYNDVFSKILLIDSTQFINVLEKQIIINLYLLKKQPILSTLSKITYMDLGCHIRFLYIFEFFPPFGRNPFSSILLTT